MKGYDGETRQKIIEGIEGRIKKYCLSDLDNYQKNKALNEMINILELDKLLNERMKYMVKSPKQVENIGKRIQEINSKLTYLKKGEYLN